jgi:hypothetical protein
MPWTPADAKRHKKGLSAKQARQWAHVANAARAACIKRGRTASFCDGSAVRQANAAVGTPARPTSNTTLLTVNTALTVEPQRVRRHDQDYLVAPCVMLVAGVLNGGLVLNEAIVPEDWNHVPVCVNHPADTTGMAVSARSPDVLSTCGMGHVFHARRGQGLRGGHAVVSLVGDLWINLADAQRCGGEALQAVQMLEAQHSLEVSTAFYPDVATQAGVFHGSQYTEVYTRLRPDHLALLPNAVGACSWDNGGCGAPRLNHNDADHACACLDAECVCQQGVMPMEDTAPRSRWQRFWSFVQEFMPDEDPEDAPESQDADVPAVEDAVTTATVPPQAQDGDTTPMPEPSDAPQDIPDSEPSEEETPLMPPTPTVKARVDALITNERTIWTELDRPDLEQLPESVLIRMEHQPLPSLPTVQSGPRTLAEVLTDLKPEDRDALEDAIVNQQERKEQLLGVLLANKQNPFSREELQVMKIKRLEQLVVMSGDPLPGQPQPLTPANYNGRRMPHLRIVTQEGEDDNTPPPLMDTMSLIVAKQKERGVRF